MAPPSIRSEPSITELIEARERSDAGLRLAFPQLLDRSEHLPIDDAPVTVVDDEMIAAVATKVASFRHDAAAELKHLDKHAPRHIHIQAMGVVAKLDDFLDAVGDYFRSAS